MRLLAERAPGLSSLKAPENCTGCNSLAIKAINAFTKGRTTTAVLIAVPGLLIISRGGRFGVCCPGRGRHGAVPMAQVLFQATLVGGAACDLRGSLQPNWG